MTHGIRKSSLKPQKSLTIPELAAMEIFRLRNPFFMTAEKTPNPPLNEKCPSMGTTKPNRNQQLRSV